MGGRLPGWAAGLDEAAVVGKVPAADHEIKDGYFSVGEEATLVAKPGSELHRWLAGHRGQKVRMVITTSRDGLSAEPQRPGRGREKGAASGYPSGAASDLR